MTGNFSTAAGSVIGRDHLWAGKNNQDAFCRAASDAALVLVVCDGCGSGACSETGAQMGARALAGMLLRQAGAVQGAPTDRRVARTVLDRSRDSLLDLLRPLLPALGGDPAEVVSRHFLFTVVGALITPQATLVFSLGDGVLALNGAVERLGPFPNNQPPYAGYGLLDAAPLDFTLNYLLPTAGLQSLLIASDGAGEWDALSGRMLPGKTQVAGPLSQFWSDERYFQNADAVRRKLSLMNRESLRPDWDRRSLCKEAGLLADDTTLVVCRRNPQM
jgi:hypothetical protein